MSVATPFGAGRVLSIRNAPAAVQEAEQEAVVVAAAADTDGATDNPALDAAAPVPPPTAPSTATPVYEILLDWSIPKVS